MEYRIHNGRENKEHENWYSIRNMLPAGLENKKRSKQ